MQVYAYVEDELKKYKNILNELIAGISRIIELF